MIFYRLLGATMALVIVLVAGSKAYAADVTHDGDMIYLSGDITEGDADRIDRMVAATGIKDITLESDGGVATEGYTIGYTLRGLEMNVYVAENTACFSACAIATLGGVTKTIDGLLGFHVAWSPHEGSYSDGMKSGQILGTLNAAYYFNMGYTLQIPYLVAHVTDQEHFLLLTGEDLTYFEMVENDFTELRVLEEGWIGHRLAGPLRINILRRNL